MQKFTADGQFLLSWGSEGGGAGEFRSPSGVCVGSDGFVYVYDLNNQRIQKFTHQGNYVLEFGNNSTDPVQLYAPYGIAMGPDGLIYVSDSTRMIARYTSTGMYVAHWVFTGNNVGVTVDREGFVYVSDSNADRIHVFYGDGTPYGAWMTIDGPYHVTIDNDDFIYVAGYASQQVAKYTNDGGLVCAWGGINPGFNMPTSVVVSETAGFIYVTDRGNQLVQVFSDPTSAVPNDIHCQVLGLPFSPNPLQMPGTLTYSILNSGTITLTLLNSQGQRLRTLVGSEYCEAGQYSLQLDLEVPAGMYFLHLTRNREVETHKVTILR